MVTLGIDASNKFLTIACFKKEKLIENFSVECKNNLSEILLLEIDNILKKTNINKKEITEIIVTKGPGSYTALRVVLSIAKTMSMVLNANLRLISSLRLQVAKFFDEKLVVPLIDARRNNVYTAVYFNKKEILKEGYYSFDYLVNYLNNIGENINFVGIGLNNYNYENLKCSFNLNENFIDIKNVFILKDYLEDSDYYTAVPSYLRITEAERNLNND